MKFRPCPKCESKDISAYDCGYSSFNPGWAECNNCGHKANAIGKWVDNNKSISIVEGWNEIPIEEQLEIEKKKVETLRNQLEDANLKPWA